MAAKWPGEENKTKRLERVKGEARNRRREHGNDDVEESGKRSAADWKRNRERGERYSKRRPQRVRLPGGRFNDLSSDGGAECRRLNEARNSLSLSHFLRRLQFCTTRHAVCVHLGIRTYSRLFATDGRTSITRMYAQYT